MAIHGCVHVQGTMNGYGERCGNVDLCTVIPGLELKMHMYSARRQLETPDRSITLY